MAAAGHLSDHPLYEETAKALKDPAAPMAGLACWRKSGLRADPRQCMPMQPGWRVFTVRAGAVRSSNGTG